MKNKQIFMKAKKKYCIIKKKRKPKLSKNNTSEMVTKSPKEFWSNIKQQYKQDGHDGP